MKSIALLSTAACLGCSTTVLRSPAGWEYRGEKDASIGLLKIHHELRTDGTQITTVELKDASGQASPVIATQGAIVGAAVESAVKAAIGAP